MSQIETPRRSEPTVRGWISRRTGAPSASNGRPSETWITGSVTRDRRPHIEPEPNRDGIGRRGHQCDHLVGAVAQNRLAHAAYRERSGDTPARVANRRPERGNTHRH